MGFIAVLVGFAHSVEAAIGPTASSVAAGTSALAALGGAADVVGVDARDTAGARACDLLSTTTRARQTMPWSRRKDCNETAWSNLHVSAPQGRSKRGALYTE